MSYADKVFKNMVRNVLENGISDENLEVRPRWEDGTPAHTIQLFGVVNRYDLQKEFPILSLRRTYWKSAWDEVAWIWQKKSNNVNDLSSRVWDAWADESGSIGKAYGYQMGRKTACNGITEEGLKKAFGDTVFEKNSDGKYLLDQTDQVIYQLVNTPASRRIMTNMYNIPDLADMALAPCAYSMTFLVNGNKLNAILNQRSQDIITASAWNLVQYALITYAMASAYGYEPGEFVHVIGSAHIYDRHIDLAKELLEKEEHDAPSFWINPDIHDFYKFTKNDFRLDGYEYSDFDHKIPVAI